MPRGVYPRQKKVEDYMSRRPAKQAPEQIGSVRLCVHLPAQNPLVLKLLVGQSTNPNFVLGTLQITRSGFKWMGNSKKKEPEREVTWATLQRLMEVGFV